MSEGFMDRTEFPLRHETDMVINVCIDVHRELESGFLEVVYKDAMELEFIQRGYFYQREKQFDVRYKGQVLKHSFFADLVLFEKVIVEVKVKSNIAQENTAQVLNYLRCSGCKVGLVVNFGTYPIGLKRVVL